MSEDLERRLSEAQDRVRELISNWPDTRAAWKAAFDEQLQAERELAAARDEQYARVIDIGQCWDVGAPLPHLISNRSRAFIVCLSNEPAPRWDGANAATVWPDGPASLFVVIEMWGCENIRFGGPNDEALAGHPLDGKGLAPYRAHEVANSAWIEDAIKVNSVHPNHSDVRFRQLRHYVLLFHDEMLEALASGIEAYPMKGTLQEILTSLQDRLIDQPHRDR